MGIDRTLKLRHELGIEQGDALIAHAEEGCLVFEKADITRQRLKARFTGADKSRSLARELISERRKEAKREEKE